MRRRDSKREAGVDGGRQQRGGDGDADEGARVVRQNRERDSAAGEGGNDEADEQRPGAAAALHLKRRPVVLRAARRVWGSRGCGGSRTRQIHASMCAEQGVSRGDRAVALCPNRKRSEHGSSCSTETGMLRYSAWLAGDTRMETAAAADWGGREVVPVAAPLSGCRPAFPSPCYKSTDDTAGLD